MSRTNRYLTLLSDFWFAWEKYHPNKVCIKRDCARWTYEVLLYSLFRNKRFILDEMTYRNDSKFAIFLEYENPLTHIVFFYFAYFIFPLMNALGYVDIDQGIH